MDYARFNYVAQPEDSISPEGIMPRIGAYDKWAIEWGYRWMPQFNTSKEEESFLNEWVVKKLEDNDSYLLQKAVPVSRIHALKWKTWEMMR